MINNSYGEFASRFFGRGRTSAHPPNAEGNNADLAKQEFFKGIAEEVLG